jgi:hypothetical protein
MPEEKKLDTDTTGEKVVGSSDEATLFPVSDTQPQQQDASNVSQKKQEDLIPKQDAIELIEKARSEEKRKLYSEIEKLRAEKTKSEEELLAKEKLIEARQQELENIRAGKVEEKESINRELRELREQNKKLAETIDSVAESAAKRIRQSELNSFREKKIREAGITQLVELVRGSDEAEIEESIRMAKKKEELILEEARKQVRSQMAHELPQPIAPDGSHGKNSVSVVSHKDRSRAAKLKGNDYQKFRDQLLQEAKQKSGLG